MTAIPGIWKKHEALSEIENSAMRHYAKTGCTSTELIKEFGLTISRANKVIYFGIIEMRSQYRERKALENIENAGIENELLKSFLKIM